MNAIVTPSGGEFVLLNKFVAGAYADYASYVIHDRALPDVRDGLKPVHRRLVYAMDQLNLHHNEKHKKAARTVGDTLGKYHPHGDSACYDAMVLMSQDFALRYPLVDGQGNWGSQDNPKSFAAMRYTEARLDKNATLLLDEVDKGTTDFVPNFDGTLQEPTALPAQVPFILLNGGEGIAIGMASSLLPHNAKEVIQATQHVLRNPDATLDDVMEFLPGPDMPTGGVITTSPEDIRKMYATGHGKILERCVWEQEGADIIITRIPFQTSGENLLLKIGEMMSAKKLPLLADLRDDSDDDFPVRLVLTMKSEKTDAEALMEHLCATTNLSMSHSWNATMLALNGRPRRMTLLEIIGEWLSFRRDVVTRRLSHRKDKLEKRIHVLDGLMKAFLNIDEVIRIIREEEQPKECLIAAFGLTDVQAEAILDTRLRKLAKLEEMELQVERNKLQATVDDIQETLNDREKMSDLIHRELDGVCSEFDRRDDKRRCLLEPAAAPVAMDSLELMPAEKVTVVLSKNGFIRAAKGHSVDGSKLSYITGDDYSQQVRAMTNEKLALINSEGRIFNLNIADLPGAKGTGQSLAKFCDLDGKATIVAMIPFRGEGSDRLLMSVLKDGFSCVTPGTHLFTRQKKGKHVFKPAEGDEVLRAFLLPEDVKVLDDGSIGGTSGIGVLTTAGRHGYVPLTDFTCKASGGKGMKLLNLKDEAVCDARIVTIIDNIPGGPIELDVAGEARPLPTEALGKGFCKRGRAPSVLPKGFTSARRFN